MRTLLLSLCFAAGTLLAQIAPATYIGSWTGAASGDFRMKLTQDAGDWKADVVFTLGTDEVKTVTKSVKVDGNKLEVVYQFELQGAQIQSDVKGERKGDTIEGAYRSTSVADGSAVDEGTWKVSLK